MYTHTCRLHTRMQTLTSIRSLRLVVFRASVLMYVCKMYVCKNYRLRCGRDSLGWLKKGLKKRAETVLYL